MFNKNDKKIIMAVFFCIIIIISIHIYEYFFKKKEYFKTDKFNLNTKYLVIVNYYDNDISWAKKLELPHIIYYKEKKDKEPFSAINKGKSETNILKFIYDFYDNLPKNLIFLHQYEYKFYHKGSIVDIVNNKELFDKYKKSKTKGYMSLNNFILGSIDEQIPKMIKSTWWGDTMEKYFGNIENYHDFTKGKIGCAQFIVSRERIKSLPKIFYKNMYDWIIKNTLVSDEKISFDKTTLTRNATKIDYHIRSNWHVSRYLEWTWELIFTLYKESEKDFIKYNNKKILCLYGGGNYLINVNDIFKNNFIKNNKIIINKNINFNDIFPEATKRVENKLILKINNNTEIINNLRNKDITIIL
jgi:hypothetical protein